MGAVAWTLVAASPGEADASGAGAAIFEARCAVCHQPDGRGQAGVYPPIAGTLGHFMAVESGRRYLADVVVFGLAGAIGVGGTTYVGQMQVAPPLTDQEAADVLNHVLTTFNAASLPADAKPLEASEIAARRAVPKAPTAVAKARRAVLGELESLGLSR